MTGKDWSEGSTRGRRKTENVVDPVGAEEVVGVLAVDVVVVDEASRHKEIPSVNMPKRYIPKKYKPEWSKKTNK